jgi:hypothetical protein
MIYPDNDGPRLVRSSDLEVRAFGDVVVQEAEERVGFFLAEADDVAREALVDIERLLTGDRVDADDGVL